MQQQFIVNLLQTNTSYCNVILFTATFKIPHVPYGPSYIFITTIAHLKYSLLSLGQVEVWHPFP